jgi:hypothetical protein
MNSAVRTLKEALSNIIQNAAVLKTYLATGPYAIITSITTTTTTTNNNNNNIMFTSFELQVKILYKNSMGLYSFV